MIENIKNKNAYMYVFISKLENITWGEDITRDDKQKTGLKQKDTVNINKSKHFTFPSLH